MERSDSKSIIPPSFITNKLPLVASLLASPIHTTLCAIRFVHRSLIKQDATLEYFRDRRPNKHSGYRRAITNNQNVFSMRWKTVGLLFLVGTFTGIVHYVVAWAENFILEGKQDLAQYVSKTYSWEVSFIVWWIFTVSVMLVSLILTMNISPVAAGSGIPQMKTELTGHNIKNYLTPRTLIAKIVGLTTAVGSGMYIGQEGPFVHIASCLANNLINMETFKGPFKRIRENKAVQLAVLEAACAVGVSSTFRAPIGGVLFSIEVTSTYYMVANYWKGFLSAISASFMSHVIDMVATRDTSAIFDPLFYVDYETNKTYEYWEVFFFLLIGIILGFCGAMVVRFNAKMSKFKSKIMGGQSTMPKEVYWTVFVGSLTASCYLFGNFSLRSYKKNIQDLVDTHPLTLHKEGNDNSTLIYNDAWVGPDWVDSWGDLRVLFALGCFFVSNFILVALSLTVSVPCGCFVPLFAGGAAFGRAVGELVQHYISSNNPDYNSLPGGYALVGAAAFTAGGTRTVSVAVIAMELTGELDFILPIFIGVFASCITGSRFSDSIYDSILKARNLPYLANVVLKTNAVVSDIMTPIVPCLPKVCTTKDMMFVLREKFDFDIPVVDSKETMLLHGTVSRTDVEHVVRQFYVENNLSNIESDLGIKTKPDKTVTVEEKERKRDLLSSSHDLLHHREVHVQAAPFILQGQTPAEDVHIIFTMLKCQSVFVTSYGMLVGVVTKANIFNANMDETEHAMDIYASLRPPPRGSQRRRGSVMRNQEEFLTIFNDRQPSIKLDSSVDSPMEDVVGSEETK